MNPLNPRTLRDVMRELTRVSRSAGTRASADWDRIQPLVAWVAERVQTDWPRLRDWFREGLGAADYVRYVALVERLPRRLSPEERSELLELTLRGLRLGDQPGADADATVVVEGEAELGAPRTAAPVVVPPASGAEGGRTVRRVDPAWTHEALALLEIVVPPGRLIAPHTHGGEDECSYVVSGELTVEVGGGPPARARAGSYVVKPRGVPHAAWNSGAIDARVIDVLSPGGASALYDALGELEASGRTGEALRRAMSAAAERHDVIFHWDRVPALKARHGVDLHPAARI